MPKSVDINDFAMRVERLCDYLLAQLTAGKRDGSADLKVIEDLKDYAADIQKANMIIGPEVFAGLSDYMSGIPPAKEEN